MTLRRLALPVVALSVMLAASSNAAEKVTVGEYLELGYDCRSVDLVVGQLPDGATKIGLRVEDFKTTIRSRLRDGQNYGGDARSSAETAHIYAEISVVGHAFSVSFKFKRPIRVPFPSGPTILEELPHFAATWQNRSIG